MLVKTFYSNERFLSESKSLIEYTHRLNIHKPMHLT